MHDEHQKLRRIIPKAVITVHFKEKYIRYDVDLRHANISPEENDSYYAPIKDLFGDRLMEMYTIHTGYFEVYVRYATFFV